MKRREIEIRQARLSLEIAIRFWDRMKEAVEKRVANGEPVPTDIKKSVERRYSLLDPDEALEVMKFDWTWWKVNWFCCILTAVEMETEDWAETLYSGMDKIRIESYTQLAEWIRNWGDVWPREDEDDEKLVAEELEGMVNSAKSHGWNIP